MPRYPWVPTGFSHLLLTMMLLPVQFRWVLLWTVCLVSHAVSQTTEMRVPNGTLAIPQEPPVTEVQVVDAFPGLTFLRPVAIVSPPGETNRVFVVEKAGQIYVITNLAAPTKTLFLDLRSKIWEQWYNENGLLGLAFHPLYRSGSVGGSNYIYVFYYSLEGHNRLSRYEINPGNANEALVNSELVLISQHDDEGSHNGGDLHFGPDGYLYVSTGDEGGLTGQFGNSRLINKDFFGGILRIDVDKRTENVEPHPHPAVHTNAAGLAYYSVPADNPFLGATQFNGQIIDPLTV